MALNTYLFVRKNLSIVALLFIFLLLDRFKRMKLLKIVKNLPIICIVVKNFRFSFIILLASLLSLNFGVFVFNLGLKNYLNSHRLRKPVLDTDIKLVTIIQSSNFEDVLKAFFEADERKKWDEFISEFKQEESGSGVFRVRISSDTKSLLMTAKFIMDNGPQGPHLTILERLVEIPEFGPGFITCFEPIVNRPGLLKVTLQGSMTSQSFKVQKKALTQRLQSLKSYFESKLREATSREEVKSPLVLPEDSPVVSERLV